MSGDISEIDICVCTFRRPQVEDTLASISRLALNPAWKIRVIIADNDETPSARALVEKTASAHALTFTYLHAPARNISVARNACLDAATAPLVAFIDDDEIATPHWLGALTGELENAKADVVLGPVQAIYPPDCPGWMRKGDFHSIRPVWVKGEIVTGYTSNVLLRRTSQAIQNLHFRPDLGRSGGEDTMFFAAIYRARGKIAYAPEATVTEIVTPARSRLLWLIKRRFRFGQTHGQFLLEKQGSDPLTRLKNVAIASAKAFFCLVAVLPNLAKGDRAGYWFLRGVMHMGVVARLLGKQELEQYG